MTPEQAIEVIGRQEGPDSGTRSGADMTRPRTVTHYQSGNSLSRLMPRKWFAYALLGIHKRGAPLPCWIAPPAPVGIPPSRRIVKLDMSAPIPDSRNAIPMTGEVFYPPGAPERCVHKSPKLPPAERKKADAKYMARRRDTGYDW